MFRNWLHRLIHWREIREIDEMAARQKQLMADLDRRIAECFTPDEWAETRDRCERQLAELEIR